MSPCSRRWSHWGGLLCPMNHPRMTRDISRAQGPHTCEHVSGNLVIGDGGLLPVLVPCAEQEL